MTLFSKIHDHLSNYSLYEGCKTAIQEVNYSLNKRYDTLSNNQKFFIQTVPVIVSTMAALNLSKKTTSLATSSLIIANMVFNKPYNDNVKRVITGIGIAILLKTIIRSTETFLLFSAAAGSFYFAKNYARFKKDFLNSRLI